MTSEKAQMLSVCCGAQPLDEISDGAGRCSRCKEGAMFEVDEDEIASIKADHVGDVVNEIGDYQELEREIAIERGDMTP